MPTDDPSSPIPRADLAGGVGALSLPPKRPFDADEARQALALGVEVAATMLAAIESLRHGFAEVDCSGPVAERASTAVVVADVSARAVL